MTKAQEKEKQEAIAKLREWLKPGDTVYTILRHVSRSGMRREIGVVLLKGECHTCGDSDCMHVIDLHPNYLVSKALGRHLGKRDGLILSGCGMDMGFSLVYELSYALFPNGFGCIGERCPSNDHSNGDRDHTPHPGCGTPDKRGTRDHWHTCGGYALKHRWL